MSENDDMTTIVRAIEEAQSLLRGRAELQADADKTIADISAALLAPDLQQALDRTRLRALSKALTR